MKNTGARSKSQSKMVCRGFMGLCIILTPESGEGISVLTVLI